jgi:hypothetical protein
MCNVIRAICVRFLLVIFAIACAGSEAFAADTGWRVSKSSGDVWVSTSGVQQVSLSQDAVLNTGDSVRTGRNGRVLLVRGQEKILISPNSVVGLPAPKSPGTTTVIQQSGSILLEVDKRGGQHFEVETPYLAAVVKGTQFRVAVSKSESYVNVFKGQVEVTDFRSGQSAVIQPGQMAKVWALGTGGLFLSGIGKLDPVRRGTPRSPSVAPVDAPAEGLSAPDSAANGQQVYVLPPRDDTRPSATTTGRGGDVASFPTSFEGGNRNDNSWSGGLGFVSRIFGGKTDAQGRNEPDAAMIAIPVGFGAAIAAVVAVRRRRQKQKQKQEEEQEHK